MKYKAIVALSVAVCAATTAHASTSSASLKLNNFTFQAIDLLPNDGNPGAYELLPDSGFTSAFVRVSGVNAEQKVAGLFSPLSLAAPSSAALSGSAAVNSTGLELHVNSQNEVTSDYDFATASATPAWYGNDLAPTIRIAPGTGLIASFNYEVVLDSSCTTTSRCETSAFLRAQFSNGDFRSKTSFEKNWQIQHGNYTTPSYLGAASYFNFTNEYQEVVLRINASTGIAVDSTPTMFAATAVPEPAMFGLLAAGLLPVLWRHRRQSPKASSAPSINAVQ